MSYIWQSTKLYTVMINSGRKEWRTCDWVTCDWQCSGWKYKNAGTNKQHNLTRLKLICAYAKELDRSIHEVWNSPPKIHSIPYDVRSIFYLISGTHVGKSCLSPKNYLRQNVLSFPNLRQKVLSFPKLRQNVSSFPNLRQNVLSTENLRQSRTFVVVNLRHFVSSFQNLRHFVSTFWNLRHFVSGFQNLRHFVSS